MSQPNSRVGTNLFARLNSTVNIALTDEDGLAVFAECVGTPPTTANRFAHGCLMIQTNSGTGTAGVYQNTGSSAVPAWTLFDTALPGDSASKLIDTNGLTVVDVGTVASAVNNLRVTGSATGSVSANAVTLAPVGSDAAISLTLAPKGATGITTIGLSNGTGNIIIGSSSGSQAVFIGNGAGTSAISLANATTAGAQIFMAGAVTGAGVTDTISIATGNAAATGAKVVNIATGTPGTSGNNKVTIGGGSGTGLTFNATVRNYQAINYIATESGSNNAIAGALTDAGGSNVTLAAGLRVVVKLAHTLQAGANTFVLNTVSKSIKSSRNVANDIGTAYASTGVIDLFYDGTQWVDMNQ